MSYNSLLLNTCDIETATKDKWGNLTTAPVTAGVKCRIVYANRVVRDFKGQEVLSTARVYFKATAPVTEESRLYFDGRWHGIQTIERNQDGTKIHHLEVAVD
jgi:hypothetical protein